MSRVKHKQQILDGLEAVKKVKGIITDAQAARCPALFYEWDGNGKVYKEGDRVRYNGTLYKVVQLHTSQIDWIPGQGTANLYAEILPGQDGTAVGEWKQPIGDTNPYELGDRVTHNGKTWECTNVDASGFNVWEPGVYGWKEVASQ
ncbi:MAG: hypothetical protein Q4A32_01020 [Lachnospiraceae bacterium]|nr:hypothetical protein [Lachnospiraceae bacterium]